MVLVCWCHLVGNVRNTWKGVFVRSRRRSCGQRHETAIDDGDDDDEDDEDDEDDDDDDDDERRRLVGRTQRGATKMEREREIIEFGDGGGYFANSCCFLDG
ncbi:hypothetical protein M0802_008890 [Mischocyttarus mexicanus]|nr:hypothetical protein M0802_008890 [Mischocyttarus mexicanus]